jgi:hypothetical protein
VKMSNGEKTFLIIKIFEELYIENLLYSNNEVKDLNLGSILVVYRNLREYYEYRMRYDEAGEFFIREMEVKRKYREIYSKGGVEIAELKPRHWLGWIVVLMLKLLRRKYRPVFYTHKNRILKINRNNWLIQNFSVRS